MPFTIEELTFLDMYKADTVENTKEEIQKALPIITDGDMLILAKKVLSKLNSISSSKFRQIDYTHALSSKNVEIADV
jgi:F420-0:gamma-glutamyl ligase